MITVSKKILLALSGLCLLFSAIFFSCSKGSDKATTIIKCVTCANGGSCINDTCRCPAGYEGTTCQTQSRQKFVNEWQVTENSAVNGTVSYQTFIEANSSTGDITSVFIGQLYEDYFNSLSGYVTGDSIYIPLQTQGTKSIVGVGYIHSGGLIGTNVLITMRYQVTELTTGAVDDFGYNRTDGTSPSQWTAQ